MTVDWRARLEESLPPYPEGLQEAVAGADDSDRTLGFRRWARRILTESMETHRARMAGLKVFVGPTIRSAKIHQHGAIKGAVEAWKAEEFALQAKVVGAAQANNGRLRSLEARARESRKRKIARSPLGVLKQIARIDCECGCVKLAQSWLDDYTRAQEAPRPLLEILASCPSCQGNGTTASGALCRPCNGSGFAPGDRPRSGGTMPPT